MAHASQQQDGAVHAPLHLMTVMAVTVAGMMAGMVRVMVTVVTQVWVGQGREGPAV